MNVRFAPASLVLGGFLAGSALAARLSYDIGSLIGTTSRDTSFPTDAAAVALGALVAVLVATWVRHRRAVAALSLLGLALLTLAPLPGSWRFEVYPQAVGAGLLLGGLVGLGATTNRAKLQTALAAGVLAVCCSPGRCGITSSGLACPNVMRTICLARRPHLPTRSP